MDIALNRLRAVLAAALVACFGAAAADPLAVTGLPIDLSANVQERSNPGGTLYTDTRSVSGASTSTVESAELLYTTRGNNFSGHSTQIVPSFASALAESNGNMGVGVSTWLAGPGSLVDPTATGQLVAQATLQQSFTYNGALAAALSLHLEIPSLVVGLIGVAPNRDGISKAESAQTMVTLTSVITHADGTTRAGASFEYGMRADEYQIPLGPGVYANYADIEITNDLITNALTRSGDDYNPQWTLDALSTNVSLGTLVEGDTVSYVYTLLATGTTRGFERGYYAFIGDPLSLSGSGGNFVLSYDTGVPGTPGGAVPEPTSLALALAGLGCLAWRRRQGRARSMVQ